VALSLFYFFSGVTVRNNILVARHGERLVEFQGDLGSEARFQGNLYWASGHPFEIQWGLETHASLAAWRASGQETLDALPVGLEADPLLADPGGGPTLGDAELLEGLAAYRLQQGSPAEDGGVDLGALTTLPADLVDFYGGPVPWGAGFDVGAHELSPLPGDGGAADARMDLGAGDAELSDARRGTDGPRGGDGPRGEGEEGEGEASCACEAGPGGPSAGWTLALLGLMLLRRRSGPRPRSPSPDSP
jgi:MYXO-CTERM domain-containing protein